MVASIIGIMGAVLVLNNPKRGGIILIISAIWLLISNQVYGVIGTVLLGIAGLLAVFRK